MEGAPDSEQERVNRRVQRVRRKLSQSRIHRTRFVTEPFDYLAREGLLEDAEEVSFELGEGDFIDIAFVQSLAKDQPGLMTQPQPTGTTVTVWVTVERPGGSVTICVTKRL